MTIDTAHPRNFYNHSLKNFGVGIEPTRTRNRWRTICLPYFYCQKVCKSKEPYEGIILKKKRFGNRFFAFFFSSNFNFFLRGEIFRQPPAFFH